MIIYHILLVAVLGQSFNETPGKFRKPIIDVRNVEDLESLSWRKLGKYINIL